ncbi:hypothetical protein BG55_22095 [Erwinia mallotivora]|uniref:Uncharacterized protein n=1 Tax=Erwinia mallotivora TaxID=69222 RepID=A0A014M623_9GAMM|nr:hypothetical protein BG55_22095 [Erwinia mallotivora]
MLLKNRAGFEPAAVRVERSETALPAATTRRARRKPSHPARPTSVERHPKGAFLLLKNRAGFEPAAKGFSLASDFSRYASPHNFATGATPGKSLLPAGR